jgi:hypothetical protein
MIYKMLCLLLKDGRVSDWTEKEDKRKTVDKGNSEIRASIIIYSVACNLRDCLRVVFFSFYWVVFFFFFRLRQIFTRHSAPSLTTLTPRAVVEPVETTKGNVVAASSTTVHAQPQSFAVLGEIQCKICRRRPKKWVNMLGAMFWFSLHAMAK